MNWNHKPCACCGKTMSADDAHVECQRCRKPETELAKLARKHWRRLRGLRALPV